MTFFNPALGFAETVSAVTATPTVDVGTRRTVGASNYVYAYNAGAVQAMPGAAVYIATNTSGFSFSVTNAVALVGITCGGVHNTTIPASYYGWVVTKGLCRARPDTNTVSYAAGDRLCAGVDDGYVSAGATLSTGFVVGYAISSGVTCSGASLASTGQVFLFGTVWS